MKPPTFEEIIARLAQWQFPPGIDGVVGIASGGIVPAALVAQRLGVGLRMLALSYRNEANQPQFGAPQLVSDVPGVYLTGKSWHAARAVLPKHVDVLPFVFVGDVDFALFRDAKGCSEWPWQVG
jgi:xanthine phosphoribosyltransferase